MGKIFVTAFTFIFAISASSLAFAGPIQEQSQDDGQAVVVPQSASTGLLRQNYITSTGKTVPRPSDLPQGQNYAPTPIERLDNQIDHSICKGC